MACCSDRSAAPDSSARSAPSQLCAEPRDRRLIPDETPQRSQVFRRTAMALRAIDSGFPAMFGVGAFVNGLPRTIAGR